MSFLFTPISSFRHRIRYREIENLSADHRCYKITINHPKIRNSRFSDVMISGPYGLEPANGYCRKGTGSLFRDIKIDNGHAELIIEDSGNQVVIDPTKVQLVFIS